MMMVARQWHQLLARFGLHMGARRGLRVSEVNYVCSEVHDEDNQRESTAHDDAPGGRSPGRSAGVSHFSIYGLGKKPEYDHADHERDPVKRPEHAIGRGFIEDVALPVQNVSGYVQERDTETEILDQVDKFLRNSAPELSHTISPSLSSRTRCALAISRIATKAEGSIECRAHSAAPLALRGEV